MNHSRSALQGKKPAASQAAPPVYRPQPLVLNAPPAYRPGSNPLQRAPARLTAPPVYRPNPIRPPAPPVYRPIQPKIARIQALPIYRPNQSAQLQSAQPNMPVSARTGQTGWVPGTAPPVYRVNTGAPPSLSSGKLPGCPPVQRFARTADRRSQTSSPVDRTPPPFRPALPASTIQRDVGFEFETGWIVERAEAKRFVAMKKKDLVFQGNGFRVEADEAVAEGQKAESEIEFVIDPPIEDSYDGEAQVRAIMGRVVSFAQTLERLGAKGEQFQMQTPAGIFRITPPKNRKVTANPQVTAGIRLDRIPKMVADPPSEARSSLITNSALVDDLNRYAETARKALSETTASQELIGYLTLVLHYLHSWAADDPSRVGYYSYAFEYIKSGPALMARTDFAGLYKKLSPEDRQLLDELNFSALALKLSGLSPLAPIIERGVRKPLKGELTMEALAQKNLDLLSFPKIDRQQWLAHIPLGKDLLSGKDNPELFEGMGALGSKVDETGILEDNKSWGAVIEFRKGAQRVEYDKWTEFAASAYNYIYELNNPGERQQVRAIRRRLKAVFEQPQAGQSSSRNRFGTPAITNDML